MEFKSGILSVARGSGVSLSAREIWLEPGDHPVVHINLEPDTKDLVTVHLPPAIDRVVVHDSVTRLKGKAKQVDWLGGKHNLWVSLSSGLEVEGELRVRIENLLDKDKRELEQMLDILTSVTFLPSRLSQPDSSVVTTPIQKVTDEELASLLD